MIRLSDDLKTVVMASCALEYIAHTAYLYLGNEIRFSFVKETREEIWSVFRLRKVCYVLCLLHAIIGTDEKCFMLLQSVFSSMKTWCSMKVTIFECNALYETRLTSTTSKCEFPIECIAQMQENHCSIIKESEYCL